VVYFCPSQLPDTEVGRHPERERYILETEGGKDRKRETRNTARQAPEKKKREATTNGVHTLYRSYPNRLFIDHL